jgi:hypothetical protein
MNDRYEQLKLLAEKAGFVFFNERDYAHENASLLGDLERFAELLVRQCIKSTLSLRDTAIDNEWNLDETFHMIVDTIVEDLDMKHIFRS